MSTSTGKQDKVLDEKIGLLPAHELMLREDGAIVGLAVLCTSTE